MTLADSRYTHSSPLSSASTWTADQTFNDNVNITLGTGGDVDLFYDGNDTYLENVVGTGGVMIGLSASPPAPDNDGVHIWKATAGSVDAHAASVLTVEGSDTSNVVLQLLGPNSSQKAIFFGEPASNIQGIFGFYGSGDSPANTFRWQMDGDQRLLYSAGAFAFQEATTISTTATDLTLDPTRNTILAKAAVMSYSEVTIASGAVTVTSNYHTVDTEETGAGSGDGDPTDILSTISGGAVGQFLFLQAANSGRDVTIKHGTGGADNIYTRDGADVTMTSTSTPLLLLFDNGSNWRIVGGQAGL